MLFKDLPALGETLEAGLFAGVITLPDGKHHAVLLLADKPANDLSWPDAMAWAETLGAQLPSRPVAALLFANARGQFEPRWHWTNESHEADGSYAWFQGFSSGGQGNDDESYEARARAVRLIQLTA